VGSQSIVEIFLLNQANYEEFMSKRRFRRKKLPQELVNLDVEALNHEGRGIARINGKVAFVDGALEGENVDAKYVRRRSSLDELSAVNIYQPSPHRVDPVCKFSGVCGGCSLQHMNTTQQIALKESVLIEKLRQELGENEITFKTLSRVTGDHWHYRRKARLAVRIVEKKGGALVGFREKYSSFITDMDDCKVIVAEVSQLITPLKRLITSLDMGAFIPQIEVAVGEESVSSSEKKVALVIRHLREFTNSDLASLLQFGNDYAIELYLQPQGVNSVHKVFPADDFLRLEYFLPAFDLKFLFHPMDFTQVNAGLNRSIVSHAVDLLELDKYDTVLDLFCGLGNFTLPIATKALAVVGIEGSLEMVARGAENAEYNNIINTEFHSADLSKCFKHEKWAARAYDKILLDPPRSGAFEIIEAISAIGAKKIVYISCNPSTLARDTKVFLDNGYRLLSAGVMDMFPHTTHVESAAEFQRIDLS
jgi:23S rRNA (uracil1939-C5)-methyltransferase